MPCPAVAVRALLTLAPTVREAQSQRLSHSDDIGPLSSPGSLSVASASSSAFNIRSATTEEDEELGNHGNQSVVTVTTIQGAQTQEQHGGVGSKVALSSCRLCLGGTHPSFGKPSDVISYPGILYVRKQFVISYAHILYIRKQFA